MVVYDRLDKEFDKYKISDKDNTKFFLKREVARWGYEYFKYIRSAGITDEVREQMLDVIATIKKIKMVKPWEFKETTARQIIKYYRDFCVSRLLAQLNKKRYRC